MYTCGMTNLAMINNLNTDMAEVTGTDGTRATMPAKFLKAWNQKMIDSMIMQAKRGNVMDRATCQAVGFTLINA